MNFLPHFLDHRSHRAAAQAGRLRRRHRGAGGMTAQAA
jgi:hypothetical protein